MSKFIIIDQVIIYEDIMKFFFWLTIFSLFLYLSTQIITLEQLQKMSPSDLSGSQLVQLTETSQSASFQSFNHQYYHMKVMHKQKIKAYNHIKQLYKHAVNLLIKNKVIPDEVRLVKSKIKPQFLNKKRIWSFSIIFAIVGSPQELEKCYQGLTKLGIQRLDTEPTINFLNEKIITLEVFNSAKTRLAKQLERFPGFEIQDVEEIEIKCAGVQNSDLLEEVLAQEFNHSEEIIEEGEIVEGVNEASGPMEMKILFKIGTINEEDSNSQDWNDQYQEIFDDTEQSSDPSSEIL